jgi:hypothetical protein
MNLLSFKKQGNYMKLKTLVLSVLLVLGTVANAAEKPKYQLLNTDGFGFVAPIVPTTSSVADLQAGMIVYEASSNLFKGLNTSGTWDIMSGSGSAPTAYAPTIQKFTSGSGTYTLPSAPVPLYIRVRMVGGGGGGGSSGTPTNGSAGGNTTFGSSFLVANGGSGSSQSGGVGGTASIAGGASGFTVDGGGSTGGGFVTTQNLAGAIGGSTPLGMGGYGGGYSGPASGGDGTGYGSGGGGGGAPGNNHSGPSGAAGGYIEAIITSPSATYSYAVGSAGVGGGSYGGDGAPGVIIVEEFYQ